MAVFTALSVAVATYGAGASFFSAVGVFISSAGFTGQLLLSAATSLVLNALTPKPSASGGANRGYQVNSRGAALDHQIIYGKVRVGGAIVYDDATGVNNKFLHRIIAVAGHEVQSFDRIYINDSYIDFGDIAGDGNIPSVVDPDGSTSTRYNDKIRIQFGYGTPTQPANAALVSESPNWTAQHTLSGIAYMYVRLAFDADVFPNGIPTITAEVKGKKVYDPRTTTTVWSDNPALCLRDYLTSKYGVNEDADNIDDTLVTAAANVCDQTISGLARYTCNGAFTTGSTPYDLLQSVLTSMGGTMWYAQGKWRMKPAYWTTPVMDLNEDDFRSSVGVSTRHSRRDNFNVVKGTFRGAETNWQVTDYPQVTNAAFVTVDGGQESVVDVNLAFTDNSIEARRLARVALEANRQQLMISASFGLRTLALQVGDNVRVTNTRFGWVNKEFTVMSWSFGLADEYDLQVNMILQETAESIFDEVDDGIVYDRDNTNLPNPFFVEGVGISAVASVQISNQKVSNIALVNITATDGVYIDSVNVEYKLSSGSIYKALGTGTLGFYEAVNLEPNFYDFRARAINIFGVKGEWTYLLNKEINAFAGDPSDVSGFDIEISGGTTFLSWEPISDPDLSHYEIKHNSNTSGANWGNSTTIIKKVARPASSATLPARSGTFLIRSYDKEGNFSVDVSTIVVLASELPSMGQTEFTADQEPTFTGTKTNAIVVSSALEIDITTSSSPTGEYFFPSYIDVDTVRSCIVTGFRTFTRKFDGGTLLWDNIPQDFDTWPDLFDTWTTETTAFGDTGVTVFVSATYDDPSGTPSWGSYLPANGASIMGRAFRFKAELNSSNAKYTPSLTELNASVAY